MKFWSAGDDEDAYLLCWDLVFDDKNHGHTALAPNSYIYY